MQRLLSVASGVPVPVRRVFCTRLATSAARPSLPAAAAPCLQADPQGSFAGPLSVGSARQLDDPSRFAAVHALRINSEITVWKPDAINV